MIETLSSLYSSEIYLMQALLFPISSEKKISIQAPTLPPQKNT